MPNQSRVVAKNVSDEESLQQHKKQLYNRQEYVVGAEAQQRYGSTRILLLGATGPAAEIVKNLSLTGVKSIHIIDDDPVLVEDASTNFFFSDDDVGQTRSEVLAQKATTLNRFVEIRAVSGGGLGAGIPPHDPRLLSILASHLSNVDVLLVVNHPIASLESLDHLAREKGVKLVACESRGVAGAIFVDGGDSFEVLDADGEETSTCVVTSISPDGFISLHEEKRPECEPGSLVYFTGIASPAALNSVIPSPSQASAMNAAELKAATHMRYFEVTEVASPYVLKVKEVPTIIQNSVSQGGCGLDVGTTAYLHTTKKKVTLHFQPLDQQLAQPHFCTVFDSVEKFDAPASLHAIFRAVATAAVEDHHHHEKKESSTKAVMAPRTMQAWTPEKITSLVSAAKAFYPQLNENLAKEVLSVFHGDLHPMACFIGGMASQEALKLCSGKFTPIQQWLYYDVRELLSLRDLSSSSLPSSSCSSSSSTPSSLSFSRYSGQVSVLGEAFQAYLQRQRVFIVGAGALGCELIKNVALMGFGGVSITDMDTVEMSNLSRQFLFRDHHIGQHKSTVAGEQAKRINPSIQISSYEAKVGAETEGVFNEAFWERHSAVLNALDNVSSRQYVDERCLLYQRPLFESGTLGTKCNTQCVIPFVSESYSQSYDPPEKSIPLCTLKNFPNAIEHTIQWARDQFERLFQLTPGDVNEYLLHFESFARDMNRDPAAASIALQQVDIALRSWPQTEDDCIRRARLLYHEYFTETFHQLLYNIPLHKTNEDGTPFWSGAKKPPTPLTFQPDRHEDAEFIFHTAHLLAKVYSLSSPLRGTREEMAAKAAAVEIPPFQPRSIVFATTPEEQSKGAGKTGAAASSSAAVGRDISLKDLPPPSQFASRHMKPEPFEKDDAQNHHIEFMTSCSNLRALAYGIPVADVTTTKRIAGQIIPAMVTTTSLVTGLVGVEVLKYFLLQFRALQHIQQQLRSSSSSATATHGKDEVEREKESGSSTMHCSTASLLTPSPPTLEEVKRQLTVYRNSFVNIAIPLLAFSDPVMVKGRSYRLPESGRVIRWSSWDRVDVNEGRELTVMELTLLMEKRYEMDVSMISLTSGKMLYMSFGGRAKDKKQLVSVLAQERGEELKAGSDFMDLIVTGSIGEEDVDVPIVRYKFRNY